MSVQSNDCVPYADQGEDQNRKPYAKIDKPDITSGGINLNAGHRVGDALLGDHPGDIPRPRHAATAFII
jgi:hypothetical protein